MASAIDERKNRKADLDDAREALAELQRCTKDPSQLVPTLLAAIWLELRQLRSASTTGNLYRITQVELTAKRTKILERDPNGLTRNVALFVDSAADLVNPSIRVGDGSMTSSVGGVRVQPGQRNDLGNIPPETELFAVSSVEITAYVVESA